MLLLCNKETTIEKFIDLLLTDGEIDSEDEDEDEDDNEPENQKKMTHSDIVGFWMNIGKIMGYRVEAETELDKTFRFDITWKTHKSEIPDVVIEVCDSGNLEKDFAALKHAHDKWRCRKLILCISTKREKRAQKFLDKKAEHQENYEINERISDLVSGSFHEIEEHMKIINHDDVAHVKDAESMWEFISKNRLLARDS